MKKLITILLMLSGLAFCQSPSSLLLLGKPSGGTTSGGSTPDMSIIAPLTLDSINLYLAPGGIVGNIGSAPTAWQDSSGRGKNAQYPVGGYNVDTLNGNKVNISYSNQRGRLNFNSTPLTFNGSYTFIAVVKSNDASDYQCIMGESDGTGYAMTFIRLEKTSGKVVFFHRGPVQNTVSFSSDSVATGKWIIIVATFDKDSKVMNLSILGHTNTAMSIDPAGSWTSGTSNLGIGSELYGYAPSWVFVGKIATILAYSKVRTKAEINGVCTYLANRFGLTWTLIQ